MSTHVWWRKRETGFSLIELLTAMVVLTILAAIAIPGFSHWLPSYRLRNAARDFFSNLQLTKMEAIKTNSEWALVVDTGSNSYKICSNAGTGTWTDGDETVDKTVDLAVYESGVKFQGPGGETSDVPLAFNSRGLSPDYSGYVYLSNAKNTGYYRVGIPSISGVVKLEKWKGGSWQ